MRLVAVDWSGRDRRAAEFTWVAEVSDGRLVALRNGRAPDAVVAHLVALADGGADLVVGLDFAFSLPGWYCQARGWGSGSELWTAIASGEGETLLATCPEPFWGRPGRRRRIPVARGLRRTEREDAPGAKSVFQIGGAGAVGTGSLRGMGALLDLAARGFAIWPFQGSGPPTVVEIYPRLLCGAPVRKSRWAERHAYLFTRFADQPAELLERAAGCEDAFDAAVSALVMAEHARELRGLAPDPEYALEGRVWVPLTDYGTVKPARAAAARGRAAQPSR